MVELRNKGRWRKKVWILLGCGIAAALILTLWLNREPRCNDRPLSEWVMLLPRTDWREDAERAIRHFGSNAVPCLLKWIPYHQPAWRRHLESFSHRLPKRYEIRVARFAMGNRQDLETGAFIALYKLGPDARAAIPALSNLLRTEPRYGEAAAALLANFGDEGLPALLATVTNRLSMSRIAAVDVLGRTDTKVTFNEAITAALVECLEDEDRVVAVHAAGILCLHGIKRDAVMRTFVQALNSNDARIRGNAILPLRSCLIETFTTAQLLGFLQDTNSPLSPFAAEALRNTESAIPALINSLHDLRPEVRASVAITLGGFDRAAEPAVPTLLDAFTDSDLNVRVSATNALFRVPDYTVFEEAALSESIKAMVEKDSGLAEMYSSEHLLPRLTKLFNHRDVRIRQMATNTFRMLSGSNVVNQTHEDAVRE
jgi:HEAT repeat protein